MDDSLSSYFAMKGLIDLRVANILAKQAMLHNNAAAEQAKIAHSLAVKAARLTSIADHHEYKMTPSTYRDEGLIYRMKTPAYGNRYVPHSYKPPLRALVATRGMEATSAFCQYIPSSRKLIDFI
jgi:hypothetical protein